MDNNIPPITAADNFAVRQRIRQRLMMLATAPTRRNEPILIDQAAAVELLAWMAELEEVAALLIEKQVAKEREMESVAA